MGGLPLAGSVLEVWRDRLAFVASAQTLGDVAQFRMGRKRLYIVNHPVHVRHVLVDRADNYRKGIGLDHARSLLGDGLLTSEGETWRCQRTRVEPALRRSRIEEYLPIMTAAAREMLDRWEDALRKNQAIDLSGEIRQLTLEIFLRTLFGSSAGERGPALGRALTVVLEEAIRRMLSPLPPVLRAFRPRAVRVRRSLRLIDAQVHELVEGRCRSSSGSGQLSELCGGQHSSSHKDVMKPLDEILTLIVAGHETTAVALTWTLYLISTHPDVEREVSSGANGRRTKLRQVMKEALRLYPPVWLIPRRAIDADWLGPHRIPPGADVLISPFALHRNPAVWPRPDEFQPARFATAVGSRAPVYFPFGIGPRKCVGASFALVEIELVLTSVLDRFRLRPVIDGAPTATPLLTLRPPDPFLFRLGVA